MKQTILQISVSVCCLLTTLFSYSQNVVINYQTWNPSSSSCDIFNTAAIGMAVGINFGCKIICHLWFQPTFRYQHLFLSSTLVFQLSICSG